MWINIQVWVALLALLSVAWNLFVTPKQQANFHVKIGHFAIGSAAVVSVAFWVGTYYYRPLHASDFYHYYIGGKYFAELGYTGIYECTALAEIELGDEHGVQSSTMRCLRTDRIRKTSDILLESNCKNSFSESRWSNFKQDISILKSFARSQEKWREGMMDHGYNATPVWGMVGGSIAKLLPLSKTTIAILTALDCILMLIMWLVVSRAFGFMIVCAGLIFWCSNYPADFTWTIGGFLRTDWIVSLVVSITALRKGHPRIAGALFAYSTLLRIFPGALLIGLAAYLYNRWRNKEKVLETQTLQFILSGLCTGCLLFVGSWVLSGRQNPYFDLYDNTKKHAHTPAPNIVSLSKLLSYSPSTRFSQLPQIQSVDPGALWREKQAENLQNRKPIFWVIILIFFVLYIFATRGMPLWAALSLGTIWPPLLTPLTGYYMMVLIPLAFLWHTRTITVFGLIIFGWISLILGQNLLLDELIYPAISGCMLVLALLCLIEKNSFSLRRITRQ